MVRNTKLPLPKTNLLYRYYRNWTLWMAKKELIEMFLVIKMAVNRKGSLYVQGTKLPPMFRERVLDLYHENISQQQIAPSTRTSLHFIQNPFSLQSLPVQVIHLRKTVENISNTDFRQINMVTLHNSIFNRNCCHGWDTFSTFSQSRNRSLLNAFNLHHWHWTGSNLSERKRILIDWRWIWYLSRWKSARCRC